MRPKAATRDRAGAPDPRAAGTVGQRATGSRTDIEVLESPRLSVWVEKALTSAVERLWTEMGARGHIERIAEPRRVATRGMTHLPGFCTQCTVCTQCTNAESE